MKPLITTFLCLILGIQIFTSCNKPNNNSEQTDPRLTEEVEKIEFAWDGVSTKKENQITNSKLEFVASAAIINKIKRNIDNEFLEYYNSLNQNSFSSRLTDVVGVIKTGLTCGNYDEIEIYVDTEDKNSKTVWETTYKPASWSIDGNKNIIAKFCVVPASLFTRYYIVGGMSSAPRYGLLRITPGYVSRANHLNYYQDTEDKNNTNGVWYTPFGGAKVSIKGNTNNAQNIYRTWVDNNGILWALNSYAASENSVISDPVEYSDAEPFIGWPDIGISYGVFGKSSHWGGGYMQSVLYSDDEDNNNANYVAHEIGTEIRPYHQQQYIPDPTGIMSSTIELVYPSGSGGKNTRFHMILAR